MVHSHDFYNQYQDAYEKYTNLYGKQVCVFLKKGSFYEFYGQELNEVSLNTAKQVMEFFGISIHAYPNEGPNGSTGFFGGVPDHTLDKWASKLTKTGWTVIVIDEIKSAAGKIRREVTRILSAGTHIDSAEANSSFFLSSLWFDFPNYGVASADLTTGQVFLYEGVASGSESSWHTDDLRHFFQVYPPRELILYSEPQQEDLLRRTFHIPTAPIHVRPPTVFEKPLTRETYLRTTFNPKTSLPLRVWLRCTEDSLREKALCTLLRFAEDHAPNLAQCLQSPTLWHPTENVQIVNNALTQLNLIKQSEQLCVEDLFTSPLTAMGKRSLRARLCTPLTNTDVIQERQNQIQWMIEYDSKDIKMALGLIADVSRLHRSIQCGTLKAADVIQYVQSFQSADYLSQCLLLSPLDRNLQETIQLLLSSFTKLFDLSKAKRAIESQDDVGFLSSSAGPKSEEAEAKCQKIIEKANLWLKDLLKNCGESEDGVYFKPTDKSMFLIHSTKSAAKRIEASKPHTNLSIKFLTSNARIEHPYLDTLQAELDSARASLQRCLATEVPYACISYSDETRHKWQQIEEWIIDTDICLSMARTATVQGWVQPRIESGKSSLKIENLRHPLIEVQKTQSKYVTHNVSLGHEKNGWLLYGMNASGKSSLMKAIGLAVLLAQVGSYVPATSMTLCPFHKIATRILNQDNLWAGLSSFAVEMSELRDIFQIADSSTLVLGDELCAGTESVSATAIVAAGIEWLHKSGSRFVLATHLHDLTKLKRITSLPDLSIWHLHVEYNRVRDVLIYHRELKPGSGSSMYGLEVANALHLPRDMIESAFSIRRELLNETAIEDAQPSTWNSELEKRSCTKCGGFNNLHAHHIQERHLANGSRNLDGTALHHPRNLVVLCAECHQEEHSTKADTGPLEDTSEGPKQSLLVAKKQSKKKFTDEQLLVIHETKNTNNLPYKLLAFKLEKEHGITITEKQLKALETSI